MADNTLMVLAIGKIIPLSSFSWKDPFHCISFILGGSNETDIVHYVDTEANIATEVCLTILDLLCLFTQHHQVQLSFPKMLYM